MSNELVRPEVDDRTRHRILSLIGTGLTFSQIAERAETTPDLVWQVKSDMRNSVDALTTDEWVAKAFVDLQTVVSLAMQEFKTTDDARSKAPLLQTAVTATKTFVEKLEKWSARNQGSIQTLNKKRQVELTTMLNRMTALASDALDDGEPHSKEEILQSMLDGLMVAALEMEERQDTQ